MNGTALQKIIHGTGLLLLATLLSLTIADSTYQVDAQTSAPISFQQGLVSGITGMGNPTTLQFGPDNRLYVAERYGTIFALTIERNGPGDYTVINQETIDLINQDIPNRTDTGEIDTSSGFVMNNRQVTGLIATGTATNPVLYVSSSDPREGGGEGGTDTNLDTNSGVISRLTWNGTSWDHLQLVRGLPRSEENHAVNGMVLDESTNTLYVTVGGFTNMGAPSFNFTYISEYAYAAAIISVDLNAIGETTYDMPTLDDPTRPNEADGSDPYDPFGGNDGLNQARIDPAGPVQLYATGFRNPYDVILTEAGQMYTVDNGPNYNWGGPPVNQNSGQCDETPNENNSETHYDNLHFVSGAGYYGGHPAPVRGNPSGIFASEADSPVPFALANPIECDYLIPGVEDGALATWVTSTNGLTEYTATNFLGQMQGDLLTVSYDGNVYRMKPTASGDGLVDLTPDDPGDWGYVAEFGGFGIVPLDITAQGDTDIFPGTIWVAVFVDKTIAVFEPVDFPCEGTDDPLLDEDGDGFDNADEIDNGTNPCSNGSKPPDNDGDSTSDLNDPDDDNDGISDLTDVFQIDAQNGIGTTLPVRYDFFQDAPGTGFFGVGFTGLMTNGTTDYLNMFETAQLTIGGTAGKATVDSFTDGTAYGSTNTQDYAFQWGVDVTQATGQFGINAQLNNPFFSPTPEPGDEQGIYFGTGDQDNYFEFAIAADDTTGEMGFEVIIENSGIPDRTFYPVTGIIGSIKVNLYLSIDPVTGTVQPRYSIDGAPFVDLGTPVALSGSLLDVVQTSQMMAVGLMAHYAPGTTPFGGTWDYVFIEPEQPGVLGANPTPLNFGNVVQNTFTEQTVSLQNLGQPGDPDISISGMSIGGGTEFTIISDPSPAVVAPGNAVDVTIRYQPVDINTDTATLDITHDGSNSPLSVSLSGSGIVDYDPLYRVNVGGSVLSDPEGILNWSADDGNNPSIYANHTESGSNLTSTGSVIDTTSPTLPAYTPSNLFNTGRWDPDGGTPEMTYEFPVEAGRYEVRLYIAEIFSGTSSVGARVWDAELEGTVPIEFDDIDRYALAGYEAGYMLAAEADVSDGALTVRFLHQVENPELQGIEIYPVFVPPASDLSPSTASLDFGGVSVGINSDQILTLTNAGGVSDPAIVINAINYSGNDAAAFSDNLVAPLTLQPGESTDVTVSLNAVDGGTKSATLTVDHDGGNAPTDIALTATAYESDKLELSPVPLDFGQVTTGTTATETLTLTNLGGPGDSDITVTDLVITGSNTYQFQTGTHPDPFIIPAGSSATVDITFSPATAGSNSVTLSAAHDGTSSPVTITVLAEGVDPVTSSDPIYRINVGGNTITDPAGVLDWATDTGSNPSPYLIAGAGGLAGTGDAIDMTHPSLPADTPMTLFQQERWDPNDGSANQMTYEFPVENGTYEVRLYLAEIYSGIGGSGQRVFDASLEEAVPIEFDDIDIFATAGFGTGLMLSSTVEISDSALTLSFIHQAENPAVKGIEILPAGPATPTSDLVADTTSADFGGVDIVTSTTQSIVLTNNGATDAPAITISDITLDGTGAAAFSTDFATVTTLQPGESQTVNVMFDPVDTITYSATMTIIHDGNNDAVAVSLSGTGSSPGTLTQDVTTLDFGSIVVNTGQTASVTVSNSGSSVDPDIIISDLTFAGTDAADFSHVSTLPLTVAPGNSAVLDVTFAPTTIGTKTAQLSIVYDGINSPALVDLTGIADAAPAYGDPIHRINTGGNTLTDPAGILDWAPDSGSDPSVYRIAGGNGLSGAGGVDTSDPSIPANTPPELFTTERWDPNDGSANEMTYEFPVNNGTHLVRLYFAETYSGITAAGQRVFNVELEGTVPAALDSIDPFATAGYLSGYMLQAETDVSDGLLTVSFVRDTENPALKGIEVLPATSTSPSTSDLVTDTTAYEFGSVDISTSAVQSIVLTNNGITDAPAITISDIALDGTGAAAFSTDFAAATTLQPGDSLTFNVTFDPTEIATYSATITITHDGSNNAIPITLTGAGKSAGTLTQDTDALDFGTVVVSDSNTASLTVHNAGAAGDPDIVISDLTFSGTDAADFNHATTLPVTVTPGNSAVLDVTFAPTTTGTKSATLTVVNDGVQGDLTATLTGTAASAPAGSLGISPTALDFGSIALNNMVTDTITLTNDAASGSSDVIISDITFGDAVFSSDFVAPATLAAGESLIVTVAFTPVVAGNYSTDMIITHDGNNTPGIIPVSGSGIDTSTTGTPIVRINVGGGFVADPAGILNWESDNSGSPSIYHVTGGNGFSGTADPIDISHPSLPVDTPMSLFQQERYDPDDGDAGELTYDIPLTAGTYEVRVYVAELYGAITTPGLRVFDVEVEGIVPAGLAGVDPYALAGFASGAMVSEQVTLSDGSLTLRFLHVIENPAVKAIEIVELSTEPVAILGTSTDNLMFGDVIVGSSTTETITLTNTGESGAPSLTISDISSGDAAFSNDFVAPTTLAPGDSLTVNVTFAPVSAGTINTNIVITHDGGNTPGTITVSGNGTQPGILSQDVSSINFGNITLNNSATGSVTLMNTGTTGDPDITISDLVFSGTDAVDFSHAETLPLSIAPGASTVIDLVFAPVISGAKSATLTIINDGTQGDLTVSMAGNAIEPAPESASAIIRIETGGNILTSSTYNPSFYVENTSTGGQLINRVTFDISSAIVPDVVFDPTGTAGDTGSRCLFPVTDDATATGFIAPADLCADPFFNPYELGYNGIEVTFSDFSIGESFLFGVDIDPTSTRGTVPPGPDDAASVSGYELLGSVATVEFNDGSILTTELWRYNTSVTGSQNIARVNTLTAPTIEVPGVTSPSIVNDPNQTIRVTGTAGGNISLLISEGEMVEQADGGYDVDPYEINTVLNVAEYTTVIGTDGTVDIPVTLLDDALIDGVYGGKNYIAAVVRDGDLTSNLSNRIILELNKTLPQLNFSGDLSFTMQEGQSLVASDSVTSATNDGSTPTITLAAVDDATGLTPTWLTLPTSITAGNTVSVDANVTGLAPGTYSATVTGTATGYESASFTINLTVNDITITVTEPADGSTITGGSFTVSWTSTGGLIDDHIHVTLDDLSTNTVEPYVGSLPQTDSYTFTGVQPGNYALIVEMANVNHIAYTGTAVSINLTVEAEPLPQLSFNNNATMAVNMWEGQPDTASDSIVITTSDGSTPTVNLTAIDNQTGTAPVWLTLPASVIAGSASDIILDDSGLAPGTYSATVTGSAAGYESADITVNLTVNDITITVTEPANGSTITGNSFTVGWTSTGGLPGDYIRLTLSPLSGTEPVVVSNLSHSGSHTFTWLQNNQYTLTVELVNQNHMVYAGPGVQIQLTVEDEVAATTVQFASATGKSDESTGIGNIVQITTSDGNPTVVDVTVGVTVTDISTDATDYTLSSNPLTLYIPAGTASGTLLGLSPHFSIVQDADNTETEEIVRLTLSNITGTKALMGWQTVYDHTILQSVAESTTINPVPTATSTPAPLPEVKPPPTDG